MLILSREVGESVIIEDVALTLVRFGAKSAEVSFVKLAGGKSVILQLPHHQARDVCYDVQVVFVGAKGTKVRLGFEAPPHVTITRR